MLYIVMAGQKYYPLEGSNNWVYCGFCLKAATRISEEHKGSDDWVRIVELDTMAGTYTQISSWCTNIYQ